MKRFYGVLFVGLLLHGAALADEPSAPPSAPKAKVHDDPGIDLMLSEAALLAAISGGGEQGAGLKASLKMADAYTRFARRPELQPMASGMFLQDYYRVKFGARGAAQVSQGADEATVKFQALVAAQNARIIEQNDQIIALLTQLAAKK